MQVGRKIVIAGNLVVRLLGFWQQSVFPALEGMLAPLAKIFLRIDYH
jgi:hypothetical protein